jgi:hypothetical protein
MNFSIGDWIVKALEILSQHATLRRMYYATLWFFVLYVVLVHSPKLIETILLTAK